MPQSIGDFRSTTSLASLTSCRPARGCDRDGTWTEEAYVIQWNLDVERIKTGESLVIKNRIRRRPRGGAAGATTCRRTTSTRPRRWPDAQPLPGHQGRDAALNVRPVQPARGLEGKKVQEA